MKADPLFTLAANMALLSLFAIGGANAAIPEMHRLVVDVQQWMTDREFTDMFALAQLSPGPNVIIVTLIGYHVAGLVGALVATAAMCGPTCFAAYYIGRVWDRFRDAPWRIAIQTGLVPLSVGLIAASAYLLARAADTTFVAFAVTIGTAALAHFTRLNPLWMFAGAGLIGFFGLME